MPKIAVYVTGDSRYITNNEKKALQTSMLSTLINSGRYIGIERSSDFLAEVDKEHIKQRSGAIDESQISQLGRQFGLKFICVADINPAFGTYQVSARIIDVETAVVVFIGEAASNLQNIPDLKRTVDDIIEIMFSKTTTAQKQDAAAAPGQALMKAKYDDTEIYATEHFAASGSPVAIVGTKDILTVLQEGKNYYKVRTASGKEGFAVKKDLVSSVAEFVDLRKDAPPVTRREAAARKRKVAERKTNPTTLSAAPKQETPLVFAGEGAFSDVLFASKIGMVKIHARLDRDGNKVGYSRMIVRNITGSPDNGTIVYTLQSLNKNMRPSKPIMKEQEYVANIVDGVVELPWANTTGRSDVKVMERTGFRLPSKLNPGDSIPNSKLSIKRGNVTVKSSTTGLCTGIEMITVPAGTFECYKIEEKSTSVADVKVLNKTTNLNVIYNITNWHARGIGEVKTLSYDAHGNMALSVELQELSIPKQEAPLVSKQQDKPTVNMPQGASIFIATLPPRADVYIGGRPVGQSNDGELQVPVGTHQVRFVKGDVKKTESMTFSPGKNPTRFVNLK